MTEGVLVASRADERTLFDLSGDIPFDDQPDAHAKLENLKPNLMVEYLHEVGSVSMQEPSWRSCRR